MPHDIIDNRSEKLLDDILTALPTTEQAGCGKIRARRDP